MRSLNRCFIKVMCISIVIVLISGTLSGCTKSVANKTRDLGEKIDEYVKAYNKVVTGQKITGNILIARGGEVIASKSYGMADYENDIPVTQDTVFRLASTTKFFTSLAIMQLYEKGLLDLKDKVSKYIPEQKRGEEITISQLLTHTSGLKRDDSNFGKVDLYENIPLKDLVSLIGTGDFDFEPGTQMVYSNAGYQLLAYIIEKVSKMPYDQYMKENIFKPANMNSSGVDSSYDKIEKLAVGYKYEFDRFNKRTDFSMSHCFGSGNIYSTVYDMYLLDKALREGKLVKKETLDKMTADNTGLGKKYGYGCFLGDVNGHKWYGHAGNLQNGYFSYYVRFPSEDLTVIMQFNTDWDDNESIMQAISTIALGEEYRLPVAKKQISLKDSDLDKFVGKYEFSGGGIVTVEKFGNGLSVSPSTIQIPLVPCSKNEFVLPGYEYYEHIFEVDKDGKVLYYIFRSSATELKMKKIE